MANFKYSETQRAEFLELASEIGITRAMRKLDYPEAWRTAKKWADAAGIEIPLDEIKAQAKAHHDWYQTEDILLVAQEGIVRTHLALQRDDMTPDEMKKMSEAFQKYVNSWLLLQGKANSINENRVKDSMNVELAAMLAEQEAINRAIEAGTEKEVSPEQ